MFRVTFTGAHLDGVTADFKNFEVKNRFHKPRKATIGAGGMYTDQTAWVRYPDGTAETIKLDGVEFVVEWIEPEPVAAPEPEQPAAEPQADSPVDAPQEAPKTGRRGRKAEQEAVTVTAEQDAALSNGAQV